MGKRDDKRSQLPEHMTRQQLILNYKRLLRHSNEQVKLLLSLTKRVKELEEANESIEQEPEPKPFDEWNEEDGNVLWFNRPIEEPPYCGCPLDSEWPWADWDKPKKLSWVPLPTLFYGPVTPEKLRNEGPEGLEKA